MGLKKFLKGFQHAWRGICYLLKTERNARFHLGMTVLVGIFAVVLKVNRLEAALLFFAVVLVFAIAFSSASPALAQAAGPRPA